MSDNNTYNPFPGLRAFNEKEGHKFFGRDQQIVHLLKKLENSRFLAVTGASGSGKSSLVRAGLIPALLMGGLVETGTNWRILLFQPGIDPIGNLSEILSKSVSEDGDNIPFNKKETEFKIRNSRNGLKETIEASDLPENENILIVVDQFEEIFRFDKIERSKMHIQRDSNLFVSLLINASKDKKTNLYVVLNIDSDYLGECTIFRPLPNAINAGNYLIPRMGRRERKQAVTGPIKAEGVEITTELTDKLLTDTGLSLDHLPILQHALMRIWDYWKKGNTNEPLDLTHYKAIGTMKEALNIHAEEVYSELKTEKQRYICEILFKTLCDTGQTNLLIDTVNTIGHIAETVGCAEKEVIEVADVFRQPHRAFLMPPARVGLHTETPITLTHKSIIRLWKRLANWNVEENKAADLYMRLSRAAEMYQEGKAALWRDPELQLAIQWRETHKPNMAWAQRYDASFERAMSFLDYSYEQQKFKIAHKQMQHKRKIKRANIISIFVGVIGLLAVISTIYAFIQKSEAEMNAQKAAEEAENARTSKELAMIIAEASEEKSKRNDKKQEMLMMSAENIRESYTTLKTKHDSLQREYNLLIDKQDVDRGNGDADSLRTLMNKLKKQMRNVQGQLTIYKRKYVQTLSKRVIDNAEELYKNGQTDSAAMLALYSYYLSKRENSDANISRNYSLIQKCLSKDKSSNTKSLTTYHNARVAAVSITPDGKWVASADIRGNIILKNINNKSDSVLLKAGRTISSMTFSKNSKMLAAGTSSGDVLIWTAGLFSRSGSSPAIRKTMQLPVRDIRFAPSKNNVDQYMFVLTSDKSTAIYNVSNTAWMMAKAPNTGDFIALNDNGDLLYALSERRLKVYKINYTESKPSDIIRNYADVEIPANTIRATAYSDKDKMIAIGNSVGGIWIVRLDENYGTEYLKAGTEAVLDLNFGVEHLAVATNNGVLNIFDSENLRANPLKMNRNASVNNLVWLPGGTQILTSDTKNKVEVLHTNINQMVDRLCQQITSEKNMKITQKQWEELTASDNSDGLNTVPDICK